MVYGLNVSNRMAIQDATSMIQSGTLKWISWTCGYCSFACPPACCWGPWLYCFVWRECARPVAAQTNPTQTSRRLASWSTALGVILWLPCSYFWVERSPWLLQFGSYFVPSRWTQDMTIYSLMDLQCTFLSAALGGSCCLHCLCLCGTVCVRSYHRLFGCRCPQCLPLCPLSHSLPMVFLPLQSMVRHSLSLHRRILQRWLTHNPTCLLRTMPKVWLLPPHKCTCPKCQRLMDTDQKWVVRRPTATPPLKAMPLLKAMRLHRVTRHLRAIRQATQGIATPLALACLP